MSIEEQNNNNNNLPPSSSEEEQEQEQDYYYQQQQAVLPITPVQRPSLIRWMLCLLVPALLLCSILSPLSLFLSLFPITLIFGLPIWISSTLTQFPDGRCQDSVRDIRCVLRWVASSIREYGGDPERIFVAGHGSGAHLSMLTVVRSAIRRSLAVQAYPSSVPPIFQQEEEEEEELPMIEGMILLSGIYDPINQLRAEARAGWLDILASRRALGPSHPSSLANSPAHLLHHALPFLEPRYLPAKFLIIHGGEDKNVPILQSHFLSTLLSTLTHPSHSSPSPSPSSPSSSESESSNESYNKHRGRIQVTFKPLKELDHLAALFALMIGDYAPLNSPPPTTTSGNPRSLPLGPPYSSIIVQQILQLVG
ncbi:hypothetical protein PGT21_023259 [Puccinia graminis f. sp. tritici]|uniref:BD-FAE-like domain-containing protein n=1 Tax=Puccinia graminis f. sp. tritici TaxID=56615 RepID=A0A5B0LZQ8_PUCGR|nr:hypothetical protein PGT21_023259 [Puccinia graminis f. sp. tritici]